ncbi:hypothetical protein CWI84_01855 [Idiomarina tyrosinivorans]|uniref:EAL domain-containing protein n=1 Tax=Idiomarina tyrosinivorans TaxID=1445662 RepID=A0A432ZUA3_9GAMM|nr:GGDEF domain-containing phosphodiesterase [Idiomarina tyrosinivorans]RUO81525.1 hypothetical protein CWI84_01855 [Idiomarina tyrosinivorans]
MGLLKNIPDKKALLKRLQQSPQKCVGVVDIRQFRTITNFYGVEFGDALLHAFSDVATDYFKRQQCELFHLYGDKFAVVSLNAIPAPLFERKMLRFYDHATATPLLVNHVDIALELAMGMGVGSQHTLALAESALEKAKQQYTSHRVQTMTEREFRALTPRRWMEFIQRGFDERCIKNYYQKIERYDASLTYYEALVRLDLGNTILTPDQFLPHAKTTRYYAQITRKVVGQAITDSVAHNIKISVNLCAEDVSNPETVAFILQGLAHHPTARLIFEISETESVRDTDKMHEFMKAVRAAGGEIAIDDFGVGFSNFTRLIDLSPNYLKIDGSIVQKVMKSAACAAIFMGIFDICSELRIPIVAEYVDSPELSLHLQQLEIDFQQGFYHGQPAPLEQVIA